jgi:ankyrin repeat protein
MSTENTEKILNFLNCHPLVEGAYQALIASKPSWRYSNYSQHYPKQTTGIHIAANFGIVKVVSELANMEPFDSRDTYGRTPLSWAASHGHQAIVKLLLEKNANIETKDTECNQTPLSWAARSGHEAIVKLLLEKNANIETKDTEYDRTPLSWAAENGHEAIVKLLEKNANIETISNNGPTPLSWAAPNGLGAVVRLLENAQRRDP